MQPSDGVHTPDLTLHPGLYRLILQYLQFLPRADMLFCALLIHGAELPPKAPGSKLWRSHRQPSSICPRRRE